MGALLSHDEHVTHLERATAAFAQRCRTAETHRAVPSCPGWTVRDLIVHLGDVHRWATAAIVEGIDADRDFRPDPEVSLADWYRAGAVDLLDAIRSTPPDREVWSFGPPPHRVSFWSRRQLHETVVHLWDLESSVAEPASIEPAVARDGIDEVCAMFYPRQVRLGRMEQLESTIGFDDGSSRWLLGPGDAPDVLVEGAAPELMLLLWKRIGAGDGDVRIVGDRATLEAVLAQRITP